MLVVSWGSNSCGKTISQNKSFLILAKLKWTAVCEVSGDVGAVFKQLRQLYLLCLSQIWFYHMKKGLDNI